MPSPTWCRPGSPPIAAAIAAAIHHAWLGPEEGASNRFADAFRKMVGPEAYEEHELRALDIFFLQPRPPEGYDPPPSSAHLLICPRCQKLRRTKYTAPQNGRLQLQALRDPDWIQAQFDRGKNTVTLAERLDCTPSLIVDWCDKHGILPPRTASVAEFDAGVAALHSAGEGPGFIARKLDTTAMHVRQSLKRQGLATKKRGHVYFEREWWRARLEDRRMTKHACSREAGIKPHAATYWVKRFGLSHRCHKRRAVTYPILADPVTLRELLWRHNDCYEGAAREVGCSPSWVSYWARRLLGRAKKHENDVPHGRREWWVERLERGLTTWEMAEEAGIKEKSVREALRVRDLLAEAYKNNTSRERERRATA